MKQSIEPLTGSIDAEIRGLSLRDELSIEVSTELVSLLARFQILFFRDQHLDLSQQKFLTRAFGPLMKKMARGDPAVDRETSHPSVLKHPETGEFMLFLNPICVMHPDGMTEEQSRPILSAIQNHAIRLGFSCRFRWSPGTIAIWGNLATQHYAVNDYNGHERLMYRTTFAGSSPGELRAPG